MEPHSAAVVKNALNCHLRKLTNDVFIVRVDLVNQDFHARFSCTGRSYVYKILNAEDFAGFPFENDLRWFVKKQLDVEKMQKACQVFVGTHDFTAFCNLENDKKDPVRTINSIVLEMEKPLISYGPNQTFINIHFKANGFLWHQVRKMVATIVAVGEGKLSSEKIVDLMKQKDPSRIPGMAPSCGLYFFDAEYENYNFVNETSSILMKRKRDGDDGGCCDGGDDALRTEKRPKVHTSVSELKNDDEGKGMGIFNPF
eukprot:TRINITY_DN4098_c0_g4_i9.p1 TRINITY_DN4098_c0_g4~~TRINITY_DN4098_c0_g4_i9.p1  ORF type:complete len:256 (+),score=59.41 TRINITY_DN4098_c0_g4_i9:366-1133(+)